jgi:hypothetical protein
MVALALFPFFVSFASAVGLIYTFFHVGSLLVDGGALSIFCVGLFLSSTTFALMTLRKATLAHWELAGLRAPRRWAAN